MRKRILDLQIIYSLPTLTYLSYNMQKRTPQNLEVSLQNDTIAIYVAKINF